MGSSPAAVLMAVLLTIISVILVLFSQSSAPIYILAIPALALALVNYNWNMGLMILILQFGGTYVPWMIEYAPDGRWVVLFMIALKGVFPMIYKGRRTRVAPIQIGFAAFCILATFTSLNSAAFRTSFYRSISLWLLFFAVFVSLWRYMDTRVKIERFMRISVYIATGMLIMGFWGILAGSAQNIFSQRIKMYYINPNTLGLMLTMQVPFTYWLASSKEYGTGLLRMFHRFAFGLSLLALFMSGSRAAIAGVLVGSMVYFAFRFKSRLLLYAVVIMTLVGIWYGVVTDVIQTRFFQGVVYRKESFDEGSGRLELWRIAWRLSKKEPVFGYGFGTSEIVLWAEGDYQKIGSSDPQGIHTHNSLLRLLIEMGWAGISFSILFFISLFRRFAHLARASPTRELHSLMLVLFATIIAGLVDSFFESWALSVGCILAIPFWTVVMLIYRVAYDMNDFVKPGDTEQQSAGIFKASRYGV